MPTAFRPHRHSILLLCLLSACSATSPKPLNLTAVAKEIRLLTNELRTAQNLAPLAPLEELDVLAAKHSTNMASQNFFDHRDPQGRSPEDRMLQGLPELLSSVSGENIAERSYAGEKPAAFAKTLMQMWQDSPEHYHNLIHPQFRHLGVGLAVAPDRIYATQSFANGIAIVEGKWPPVVKVRESVYLRFRLLADFPSHELHVLLQTPDPNARIPGHNGSTYLGKGPLTPHWFDGQHFSVNILTVYGIGDYQLAMGHSGQYYQQRFRLKVE